MIPINAVVQKLVFYSSRKVIKLLIPAPLLKGTYIFCNVIYINSFTIRLLPFFNSKCVPQEVMKTSLYPAKIYLLKPSKRNTGKRCKTHSKLTMKTHVVLAVFLLILNLFHTFFLHFSC